MNLYLYWLIPSQHDLSPPAIPRPRSCDHTGPNTAPCYGSRVFKDLTQRGSSRVSLSHTHRERERELPVCASSCSSSVSPARGSSALSTVSWRPCRCSPTSARACVCARARPRLPRDDVTRSVRVPPPSRCQITPSISDHVTCVLFCCLAATAGWL